ncbi:methylenetetrahydrofolate reductase [Selenomonas ruminis]|uniref:Methylenetetrahydrofolate reductase n=1 Tax=Selenomonas ruminis TaxID=2593411 RepID=A0A5D6W7J0_9FIRM|nr:methylenetetrahydrofolate reductase [Selenomonas sp. mPRGC5]TYZ23432.1 methylenetetrahydrofolate reductase [Selenomonas sp. mPRGC5]
MKRVSVELVPRDEESLRAELALLQQYKDKIDVINIPDLLRFETRSWQGAAMAKEYFPQAMPHIRAMDINLAEELPMKDYLREHDIREVLVIEGDPPQRMTHAVYPTESTDVIRKFREEMPEIDVYAGIDQYRSSMREELYRVHRKVQAGAKGFFTQPFYDMRYLEMYADMLDGLDVYWGVSPVMTAGSQSYWERKNNVVFPKSFEPGLEWSVAFSREVKDWAEKNGENIYLMPIRTNLEEYLAGVFATL